jgi:phosphate transport system permease protein
MTIGALTFIAFLPSSPISSEFPFVSFEWLESPFTVLPIQMFNWTSRPTADFHRNAAATGIILIIMTLGLNAIAVYVRARTRRRIKW